MRESGFDPSDRFGKFNVDIIHYNPVCLNSLLYLMESQTAEILRILDRPADAAIWEKRAQDRAARINQLMWDEPIRTVLRLRIRAPSPAPLSVTSLLFIHCGPASRPRSRPRRWFAISRCSSGRVACETSINASGNQWDSPFGWAPIEMIAVEGLAPIRI